MGFRLPDKYRLTRPDLPPPLEGCGWFRIKLMHWNHALFAIASSTHGWEHVSVSVEGQPKKCPTWDQMCVIKAIFWEEEDEVIQVHPAQRNYVNLHPGCLHLWRKCGGFDSSQLPPPELCI